MSHRRGWPRGRFRTTTTTTTTRVCKCQTGFARCLWGKKKLNSPLPRVAPCSGADRYHRSIGRSSAAKGLFFAQPNPFKFASRVRKRRVSKRRKERTGRKRKREIRARMHTPSSRRCCGKKRRRYLKRILLTYLVKKELREEALTLPMTNANFIFIFFIFFYFYFPRQDATRSFISP